MSALSRRSELPFGVIEWQPGVVQLMDEDHLVAWSGSARKRLGFAASLTHFLESLRFAEVCVLYGRFIRDLDSFCHQLERAIPGEPLERRVDGPSGVAALLRSRQTLPGRAPARYRYYIWHDADVLLEADADLFARLVDVMTGVAAEAEYVDDDLLLIHRVLFLGSPVLAASAADESGPFRNWHDDGTGMPFWEVVTGLLEPPIAGFDIDAFAPVEHGE